MERNPSTGPAADPAPVGEADHVSKSFGETRALFDVSLDIRAGECHGLGILLGVDQKSHQICDLVDAAWILLEQLP